jgi:predicted RNase H-like HicB family nuclease
MTRTYVFAFNPEPEGGYTVTCPALPGLVTYGESLKEAREMARDASEGLIEAMIEQGTEIPESDPSTALKRYERFAHTLQDDRETESIFEHLTVRTSEMV